MSLIDRKFLTEILLQAIIKKNKVPINGRGIGAAKHVTDEYCLIDLCIPNTAKGRALAAHIRKQVHIVDSLKAKMLMGIDILGPERMSIDVEKQKLIIRSYNNLTADIKVKAKDNVEVRRHVRD